MTREIKFRAWDGERMFLSPSEIQHLGSWFDGHWPGALAKPDQIRLMQYTGLHDKNGVEIYEGDILGVIWCDGFYCNHDESENYRGEIYQVKYQGDNDYPAFDLSPHPGSDANGLSEMKAVSCGYKVIGNIYENPELLEAVK